MSQESCMIIVDNSDYMNNKDYLPTRWLAQREAVEYFCSNIRKKNVESTCGIMSSSNPTIYSTLTTDIDKVKSKINSINVGGQINFSVSIKTAKIALKHRPSLNQKQKIIIFVGSPICEEESELIKIAKRFKKENIYVNVICFGEVEYNKNLLTKFMEAIQRTDEESGILLFIEENCGIKNTLKQSLNPLAANDNNLNDGDFGDEIDDPDLLHALRISMQEGQANERNVDIDMTDEEMLRRAIAESMQNRK